MKDDSNQIESPPSADDVSLPDVAAETAAARKKRNRAAMKALVESGAVSLFFPHGVGHMIGLGARDAGLASDELREPEPGLPGLRIDIELAPSQAWTVEPVAPFAVADRDAGSSPRPAVTVSR